MKRKKKQDNFQFQPSSSPPLATSALESALKNSSRLAGVSENRCWSSTTEAATGVGAGGTGAAAAVKAVAVAAAAAKEELRQLLLLVGVVGGSAAEAPPVVHCCCAKRASGDGSCGVGGGVAAAAGEVAGKRPSGAFVGAGCGPAAAAAAEGEAGGQARRWEGFLFRFESSGSMRRRSFGGAAGVVGTRARALAFLPRAHLIRVGRNGKRGKGAGQESGESTSPSAFSLSRSLVARLPSQTSNKKNFSLFFLTHHLWEPAPPGQFCDMNCV